MSFYIKVRVLFFFIILLLTVGCAKGSQGETISETRLHFDTYCTITIHDTVDPAVLNEAFDFIDEFESLLSMTVEGSDIWRINNARGEPVPVDMRTIEVIIAGVEFGKLTGGMFDITIGRLSRLWDYSLSYVPSDTELEEARSTVNYLQVVIDDFIVRLVNPGARIDLGAIAKGYIGDKLAAFLIERGITSALIDFGGDVITIGSRHDGKPWRIALREPFGEINDWLGVIEVSGVSVISSGIYERQFELNGTLYHHILDPNTAMPVKSDVVSATVVSESAMVGEGLSTSLILMGSSNAEELFDKVTGFIGAVLVLDTGEILIYGDIDLIK